MLESNNYSFSSFLSISTNRYSLGVDPPHLGPPFFHRLSSVFNAQSSVGFPSFAFTSLCLSQTQALSASLEDTSGGCSSMSRLKSSLHTVHGYKSPSASKTFSPALFLQLKASLGMSCYCVQKSPRPGS